MSTSEFTIVFVMLFAAFFILGFLVLNRPGNQPTVQAAANNNPPVLSHYELKFFAPGNNETRVWKIKQTPSGFGHSNRIEFTTLDGDEITLCGSYVCYPIYKQEQD